MNEDIKLLLKLYKGLKYIDLYVEKCENGPPEVECVTEKPRESDDALGLFSQNSKEVSLKS